MWNFQRIICIWICCVSCMFGTTQLSSLVQAVPYEYFDDHEQSFYDLDTEQIQAKYDARLLTQQMLQTQQQQQQHLENLKGFHNSNIQSQAEANRNTLETRKQNGADVTPYISATATKKLKNNNEHTLKRNDDGDDDDDDDDIRHDWLEEEEVATKTAASTTAITETLDELHLPRAASCFTNGQKYTHGQKVPRLDSCEVCLCMDGEIFCWWEKCDKKPTKVSITYDDYSTPFEESSTTRVQLNPKTTHKTTLKPMKKPKTNKDYKYDDDDSAEIREMQQEYEGLKEELMQKQYEQEQHKIDHNKQMVKKKIYQQHDREKHNKKIKEENKKNTQEEQQKQQQHRKQQKQHKINEHMEQHHHAHNHNRNNNHDYGSSGSSSKILNFPENLPSVLYYDYKTEEHHQHQHQHREQHLKHQKQKQQLLRQQHEKELKHQQQQQQQPQQYQEHHINRHHDNGQQDFNTHSSSLADKTSKGADKTNEGTKVRDGIDGPSTTFKYFSNGNENIYNADLQTDSDILPEPPTKRPKFSTSITDTTTAAAAIAKTTTPISITQFFRMSTSSVPTTIGTLKKSTATTTAEKLTNTPSTASMALKKHIFAPWDFTETKNNNSKKNDNNSNSNSSKNNNNNNKDNNESIEDIIETDDQDDAFHRWLTSTEINNKNNFTLNDAITGRDDAFGLGIGGLDASNSDYNLEERNYENIDFETETGILTATAKTIAAIKPLTTIINGISEGVQGAGTASQIYDDRMYGNGDKSKYEPHFSDDGTKADNNMDNSNGIINNNGNNNNDNILPLSSSPYRSYNRNTNNMDSSTRSNSSSTSNGISSTTSNEDNGVASVVNIDIMLTAATSAVSEQPQQTNIETTNQLYRQLQDFEHETQVTEAQLKFRQPPVLISNKNDVDNNDYNKNPLYLNDNNRNINSNSNNNYNNNNNNNSTTSIIGEGLNIEKPTEQELQNVGVNLSSVSNSSHSLSSSSSDSFSLNHISAVMSQTNLNTTTTTPPSYSSTTLSPERQCNVMGTLYKIGDVLPQDTGNCLQCICIDGSTSDDTPRVTCSPHNCPPLVLPDLFDATGY